MFAVTTWRIALIGTGMAGLLSLAACQSDSQENTESDPTTRALADPMGYSPNFDNDSVTGGKTGTDADSQGLKKDLNNVLNPPPP
jgi:hypothetical protein